MSSVLAAAVMASLVESGADVEIVDYRAALASGEHLEVNLGPYSADRWIAVFINHPNTSTVPSNPTAKIAGVSMTRIIDHSTGNGIQVRDMTTGAISPLNEFWCGNPLDYNRRLAEWRDAGELADLETT